MNAVNDEGTNGFTSLVVVIVVNNTAFGTEK